jgi:hypothetical protein
VLRRVIESRSLVCTIAAAAVWTAGWFLKPLSERNVLFELIHLERPVVYHAIRWSYIAMWFTSPLIVTSILISLAFIFVVKQERRGPDGRLPRYPDPAKRKDLSVVIGEVHHLKMSLPTKCPFWLTIPKRGLYAGIEIVGAIGSGKTSCCM